MRLFILATLVVTQLAAAEPYLAPDPGAALEAARKIIASDPFATLVTIDDEGQARARTIEHSGPDEDFVIYLSTIPGTRKLDQIRNHSRVTLYFDGPGDTSYVSIMGEASILTDAETIMAHDWREAEARTRFWPDFPDNYVLIRITPDWLEVVAPGIRSRERDWRPQAVVID